MFIHTNISSLDVPRWEDSFAEKIMDSLNPEVLKTFESEEIKNIRTGSGTASRDKIRFDIEKSGKHTEGTISVSCITKNHAVIQALQIKANHQETAVVLLRKIEEFIRRYPSFSLRLLTGYHQLTVKERSLDDVMEGLAVATRMTTIVRTTHASQKNIQDGISLLETCEESLSAVSNLLQRMRDASAESDSENFLQYKSEIHSIVSSAHFNGVKLLNNGTITLFLSNNQSDTMNIKSFSFDVPSLKEEVDSIDLSLDKICQYRAYIGSQLNRLSFILDNTK